jgi:hypothetical protein
MLAWVVPICFFGTLMHRIFSALFLLLLAFPALGNWSVRNDTRLKVATPDDDVRSEIKKRRTNSSALSVPWNLIVIAGNQLIIGVVSQSKRGGWRISTTGPIDKTGFVESPIRHAVREQSEQLALPNGAILGFHFRRIDRPGPITTFAPGKHLSALSVPIILGTELKQLITIRNETWTLTTTYQRRPDGQLLAESLSLIAINSGGVQRVLVPPAAGMAFLRQELVWVGRISAGSIVDFVLRRIWLTGEIE